LSCIADGLHHGLRQRDLQFRIVTIHQLVGRERRRRWKRRKRWDRRIRSELSPRVERWARQQDSIYRWAISSNGC
jgi:hypothetical protein